MWVRLTDEIPYLEWGEYPVVEALTLAVHEIMLWRPQVPKPWWRRQRSYRLHPMST